MKACACCLLLPLLTLASAVVLGGCDQETGGSGGTGGAASGGASPGGAPTAGSGGAPAALCDATCHFVRADAAGRRDGSDWTHAWTELPASLERGHAYYVADGDYPAYAFDDAPSGSLVISVRKATLADHGNDVGWQASFGDGRAAFGPLVFSQPYYLFDGGSESEIVGAYQGDVVTIDADQVVFRRADVNGNFGVDTSGQHSAGACTGLSVGGSHVTVEDTVVHDVADDGVSIAGASYVTFRGNTVHALHACGTDATCQGPCYNGHSDGLEIYNVKHSSFENNFVYDVRSTSTFFFGNWADSLGNGPSEYCEDILLANNVLYAPEVGLVAYLQDVVGAHVYHNVFWGLRQGRYGGLAIGLHIRDLYLFDNIILSINLSHIGTTFDSTQHHGDYNLLGVSLGEWPAAAHDRVAIDAGFVGIPDANGPAVTNPAATDFALESTSPALDAGYRGSELVGLPSTDFLGRPRGATPDLGAFEQP